MNQKAVVFDLGCVLLGYAHEKTLSGLAAICRTPTSPDDVRRILHSVDADLTMGRCDAADFHAYLCREAGASTDPMVFATAFNCGLSRDDAALAYACELRQRPDVRVGVISNTNATHVAWMDEHAPEVNDLDVVLLSSVVGLAKPDPRIYRMALAGLNVAPHNALFVDDIPANVDAAHAVGMAAILHKEWAATRPQIETWLRIG